ncbi:MAG: histidinol dehydrogenase, partial [Propionibacteriaceae bacterium]|nr:histidinol dehydrogenase [Propionibacteriaceae bacterium]
GRDHFALSNGQILGVEGATFHGALQTTTAEGHYPYRPDITGYTMEIAVENARVVVDAFSSLVVQGYDVLVLEGGMTWMNVYFQLGCVGVMVAGAIFVGSWSPVSLGDYTAGSTHVLPTGGCACHSSGLNVKSFLKAVHVIEYDKAALLAVADLVETFAAAEDLPAHGNAITIRRES